MSITAPVSTESRARPIQYWTTVITVALGTFAVITSELLPVGLLNPIADDLTVTSGAVGQLISIASVVAGFSALLVTVLAGRLDRRTVLATMLGVLVVANVVSAVAESLVVLMAARVGVGVSVGGFWAIGASLVPRLVPKPQVPRATAIVFSGVSIATVIGVPAGTFLGDHAGWRSAFVAVSILGFIVLLGVLATLPRVPATSEASFGGIVRSLRIRAVRDVNLTTLLVVIGHFAAYTYVAPVLASSAGLPQSQLSSVLMVYGAAGIAGTFIVGALPVRYQRISLSATMALLALSILVIPLVDGLPAVIGVMALWGLAYGATPVGLQTWLLHSAPEYVEPASAIYVSLFQFAIAGGAIVGGFTVDRDVTTPLWTGGALAAAAFLTVITRHRTHTETS